MNPAASPQWSKREIALTSTHAALRERLELGPNLKHNATNDDAICKARCRQCASARKRLRTAIFELARANQLCGNCDLRGSRPTRRTARK